MYGASERLVLPAGGVLFAEGDDASSAYLIMTGRLELVGSGGSASCPPTERQAGEMVGEGAIVDGAPRSCSARAITPCELLVIQRRDIIGRFETVDPVLRLCIGAVLDRGGRRDPGSPAGRAEAPSDWAQHFSAARDLLAFEHQLRRGIEAGELELYFQPIVHLASRRIAGLEALLRWHHPERGLIPPDDFIPMAEASGVICEITLYCLRQVARLYPALAAAASANASASGPLFVSVNISGIDLVQESFAGDVASILVDSGLDPKHLRLEVTESVLMTNAERAVRTLQDCRAQGIKVAIDDFGKGYSSLNYLNTLPVSVLKLDRSFVNSLLVDTLGRKIIAGILRLGAELDLSVIAEGIEQEAEAEMLEQMGCDLGQGYLFGAPRDLARTLALIQGWPTRRDHRRSPSLAALTG